MSESATISARMDYWRGVFSDAKPLIQLSRGWFGDDEAEYHPPLYGYAQALRNTDLGVVLLSKGHQNAMGNCLQCGGYSLLAMESLYSKPSWKVLGENGMYDVKCTRIDIAIDVFDGSLTPSNVYSMIAKANIKTRYRKRQLVIGGGDDMGSTLYLGTREGATMVRIYDKGVETGTGLNWVRFEAVFSENRAREVWSIVRDLPDAKALLPIAKAMLTSLVWSDDPTAWNSYFGGEVDFDWAEIPRVESDKMAWLMTQVAPTFRASFDRDGDWRYLDEFVRRVKQGIE